MEYIVFNSATVEGRSLAIAGAYRAPGSFLGKPFPAPPFYISISEISIIFRILKNCRKRCAIIIRYSLARFFELVGSMSWMRKQISYLQSGNIR